MSEPALAPRNAFVGVAVVWAAALVAAISIALFVAEEWRMPWLLVGIGGVVLLAFALQLWYGQTRGFIYRIAISTLGALVLFGIVSATFGLAMLVPA